MRLLGQTPSHRVGWLGVMLALLTGTSCRKPAEPPAGESAPVRGQPIARARVATGAVAILTGPPSFVLTNAPEVMEEGFLRLGFDRLSAFKFDIYEVYSETNAGRPLLRSDDRIPPAILAYDGRKVSVRGFVLPLRLKKGRVVEFLLLRDQGTCCFGPQAQINHFMRVRYPAGTEIEQGRAYRVRGIIRVGEVYVQGYLTGIYNFEAESVERSDE